MQSRSQAPPTGRLRLSTNGREEEIPTDEGSAEEEAEFNWEEFMEESGACAAPHTAFKHVETSLQSSFQPGMKLEVANRGGGGGGGQTYWVAAIVTTCGPLLLLRYCGYGRDRKADFWCDVMTAELHPVGWCAANAKTLAPPPDNLYLRKAIQERFSDWTDFLVQELTGARTAPANLLEGPMRGRNTVDLVVEGSLVEVRDPSSPALYWPAGVVRNVGGRLLLRYVGLGGGGAGGAGGAGGGGEDFWLFYLDSRLRPLGWATENSLSLEPPSELRCLRSAPCWQEALKNAQQEAQTKPLPLEVFKDQEEIPAHGFSAGMKMEMVSPRQPPCICPVSVTKVFDQTYFQVTVDDLSPGATPLSALCWAGSPGLLPAQWGVKHGVGVARPRGYEGPDFDWAHYLKHSGAPAAPQSCFPDEWQSRGFTRDACLEAVNPLAPSEVCAARITQVKGRLMWLQLEGVSQVQSEFIVDVESMDIFPVGWCEANGYTLTTSHKPVCQKQKRIAVVQPEKQLAPPTPMETAPASSCPSPSLDPAAAGGRYCCSKIFINHRCFSGPYLNKGRIAELPQAVGPGKCSLVLKEVLTLLTNAAYKPGRVLKELQEVQEPSWECHEEVLKAKYKGKPYRASMRVVRLAEQVPAFCRTVCLRLQCCPNLFGPALVTAGCPENCSTHTKTKYTYYYGKRRRLARPSGGGEERAEADPVAKPAQRRRRKRKAIFVQRKRRSSAVDHTPASSLQDSDEDEEEDEEDMDFQSGSEESNAPAAAAAATSPAPSTRPRRAASLRHRAALGGGGGAGGGTEGRRRSARALAAYGQNNNNNNNNKEEEEEEEEEKHAKEAAEEQALVLDSNPLEWSVEEVVRFISSTDCSSLAPVFQEQDIDGQALLLLTLPTVQECMELKLGPAIKLCHQIERVKVAFYRQYAA